MARVKILAIDQKLLMGMFRGEHHYRIISNSIPIDARVVQVHLNPISEDIEVMIESKAFKQVGKDTQVEYLGNLTPVGEDMYCDKRIEALEGQIDELNERD